MSRVPMCDRTDLPEQYRYLFTDNAVGELDLFRAMGNAPSCMQSYMRFGTTLWDDCGLDPRERELAILATARALDARYEWHQHVGLGRDAGLTTAIIRSLGREDHETLSERDRVIAEYAAAVARGTVDDALHRATAERLADGTVVGLALLAAYYGMTAQFIDAMGITPEDAFVGWEPPDP